MRHGNGTKTPNLQLSSCRWWIPSRYQSRQRRFQIRPIKINWFYIARQSRRLSKDLRNIHQFSNRIFVRALKKLLKPSNANRFYLYFFSIYPETERFESFLVEFLNWNANRCKPSGCYTCHGWSPKRKENFPNQFKEIMQKFKRFILIMLMIGEKLKFSCWWFNNNLDSKFCCSSRHRRRHNSRLNVPKSCRSW